MKPPEITDFTAVSPPEDDLDAYHAWKEFGGLDVSEAYAHFCSHPERLQEDFMFMGAQAFLYYFPVIDRYIREVEAPVNGFDDEAWILGCAIVTQFESDSVTLTPIRERVEQLCDFVLDGLTKLPRGSTFRPIEEIVDSWTKAKQSLSGSSGKSPNKKMHDIFAEREKS